MISTRIEPERHLQGGVGHCDLYRDLTIQDFRCSLDGYCDVGRQAFFPDPTDGTVRCVGELDGEYSILVQGYRCLELKNAGFQACGNVFLRVDYNQFESLTETSRFDFLEGFSFVIEENKIICLSNPTRVCGCEIFLEGQRCNSCNVCGDGEYNSADMYYSYAVDCSNLGTGLVRDCEADGYDAFYVAIENALPLEEISTGSPIASPIEQGATERVVASKPSSNDGLSSAAMGAIIGAAVAVTLLLALTLFFVLVNRGNDGSKVVKANQENDSVAARSPTDVQPRLQVPVTAEVLMVDNGSLDEAFGATPTFKDQIRQQ